MLESLLLRVAPRGSAILLQRGTVRVPAIVIRLHHHFKTVGLHIGSSLLLLYSGVVGQHTATSQRRRWLPDSRFRSAVVEHLYAGPHALIRADDGVRAAQWHAHGR